MKAILLAAGMGSRLKPITNHTPKCLVEINQKPLLQIWLENLSRAGIDEFLINTHYRHEQVESFIHQSPFKHQVMLSYEKTLIGTAGTLLSNQSFYNGQDVLVVHADNLCICDWQHFFQYHQQKKHQALMTMMCFITDTPRACGIVQVDSNHIMESFHEKSDENHGLLANGAVYMLGPQMLSLLKQYKTASNLYDFSIDVLPNLNNKVATWLTTGYLRDIGTIESLKQAHIDMEKILCDA